MAKIDVNNISNPEDSDAPKAKHVPHAPNAVKVLKAYDGRLVRRGERCRLDTTNVEYSQNPDFKAACEEAGIPATRRQASKFRRGFGTAFEAHRNTRKVAVA